MQISGLNQLEHLRNLYVFEVRINSLIINRKLDKRDF